MTHRQRTYALLLLTGWLTAAAFMPMTISPIRFLAVMGTVALVAWGVAFVYDAFSDLRALRRQIKEANPVCDGRKAAGGSGRG